MSTSKKTFSVIITTMIVLILCFLATLEVHAADVDVNSNTDEWYEGNTYHVRNNVTVRYNIGVNGKVTVYIEEGATLTAARGIQVNKGSELSIEGKGKLITTGDPGYSGAGIGPRPTDHGGDININILPDSNVTVEANARGTAAGIGASGDTTLGSNITIGGGHVIARGLNGGAGIGAAAYGNASDATITINGGTVEAYSGGDGAAGIGGGEEDAWPWYSGGEGATVYINGGTVIASGWCAIGHGRDDSHMGDLYIASNMKVYAGNDGTNYERDGKPFTAGERAAACNYRKNARIEVCDHPDNTYSSDEYWHTRTCSYCESKFESELHSFKTVDGSAVEGTCVTEGKKEDQKCVTCGYLKTGESTGYGPHEWNKPTYTWTDDNSKVTAAINCKNKDTHREEEEANTTSEVTKEPTCTNKGETTYTAVFENAAFETQTKTVEDGDINPDNHVWGEWKVVTEPTTEDKGLKERVCTENSEHKQTEEIPVIDHTHKMSHVPAKAAACEEDGNIEYWVCDQGANPCNRYFSDEKGYLEISLDDTVIPATGHNWDFHFEWKGNETDGYTGADAVYECSNNSEHDKTFTLPDGSISMTTKPQSCEESGKTTYSVTYSNGPDGKEHSQSIDGKITAPLGHDWGSPQYKWQEEDGNEHAAMYAVATCSRDTAHTVEEKTYNITSEIAKDATCEEKGETTYTATFETDGLMPQSETVADIPAKGHDWGEATYSWSVNEGSDTEGTCTAIRQCKRNLRHEENETVKAEFRYIEPSCTTDGSINCSSDDFTNEGFEKQVEKETLPALGHDWSAWKVTKKPTTTAKGIETRVCKRDSSHKETRDVAKLKNPVKGTLVAKSVAKGSKALKISWTKVQNVSGYDIYFVKCGKNNTYKKIKTIKGNKTFTWTKTGLKKNTPYKVYVRAYVTKNGKKTYVRKSNTAHAYTVGWSKVKYTNAKSVTAAKTSLTVKKGKTVKLKASVNKLKKGRKLMHTGHIPRLRYISSNKKVATVTKNGKIKGVKKGTCTVYVLAHNGISKKVKVTVK